MVPPDAHAGRNVIVEIRGAEGGEEANLFARNLYEMYVAYSGRHGLRTETLAADASERGGFNAVTFLVSGERAWPAFKYEGGGHRVQRVPVTESQGRIHTSSATVMVLPEADEIDVQIDDKDLQIDVFRSSGPGGQSVNTTDSAVRVTHLPTGIVVSMQDERSQLQNRNRAMTVLRSRLLELAEQERDAKRSASRRAQVGGGGAARRSAPTTTRRTASPTIASGSPSTGSPTCWPATSMTSLPPSLPTNGPASSPAMSDWRELLPPDP